MIARNYDGSIIDKQSKIYMPHPARFGMTDAMGRGPYEKSGMIRDTGLPPLRTVREQFEITFPYEDVKQDGGVVRRLKVHEMEVEARLLYVPFGDTASDHFVWFIQKHLVRLN